MNYKIVDKCILWAYKEAFNHFDIDLKVFPLSFNQQKEHNKDSVKLGYCFNCLKQQLDFTKYMKIKYLGGY